MKNDRRKFINVSNRKFEPTKYVPKQNLRLGYKPKSAFWCSIESDEEGYYSEWDAEYGEVLQTDENGNLHITITELKPNVYELSPATDKTLLEGFQNFVKNSPTPLTTEQKRKLLTELIRSKKNFPDVEYVICQIQNPSDLSTIEEIFGGYRFGEENADSVYENLGDNVVKGFMENFSAVEVTAEALDVGPNGTYMDGINQRARYQHSIDPKYDAFLGGWEMHSIAVFDTDCLNILEEIIVNAEERSKRLYGDDDERLE